MLSVSPVLNNVPVCVLAPLSQKGKVSAVINIH